MTSQLTAGHGEAAQRHFPCEQGSDCGVLIWCCYCKLGSDSGATCLAQGMVAWLVLTPGLKTSAKISCGPLSIMQPTFACMHEVVDSLAAMEIAAVPHCAIDSRHAVADLGPFTVPSHPRRSQCYATQQTVQTQQGAHCWLWWEKRRPAARVAPRSTTESQQSRRQRGGL